MRRADCGWPSRLQRTNPGQQVVGPSRQTRAADAHAPRRRAGFVEHLASLDPGSLVDQHLTKTECGLRFSGGIAAGSRLIERAAVRNRGGGILERSLRPSQSGERLRLDSRLPHSLGKRDAPREVVQRG
jgi:hypothetical protein